MPRTSESPPQDTSKNSERRYGGMSAQERSQQRREKLLEAAIQVFGTLGLRKATMRDICNEARIAERYFSEHFATASDAYEAAFKQISEQAVAATGAAMVAAPLTTHDMAIAGLTAFFRFVKEDPRRAQILLIDASSYWRHVTVKTNPELNRHALLMKRFAELIYPGLPENIRLDIIGAALIGASLQPCLTWVQSGFKQPIENVVSHLMFVWDGLDQWLRSQIEAEKSAKAAAPAAVQALPAAGKQPARKTAAAKTTAVKAASTGARARKA
ncbi:MAG: TetR/AcrR family transcriptional regulator [Aquabacterium sp.]